MSTVEDRRLSHTKNKSGGGGSGGGSGAKTIELDYSVDVYVDEIDIQYGETFRAWWTIPQTALVTIDGK